MLEVCKERKGGVAFTWCCWMILRRQFIETGFQRIGN